MKCPKCHFENPEQSKFCLECGKKLELLCPHCGKSLPAVAKFCNECGYDLSKPSEAPPLDYSVPKSYTPKFLAEKILKNRSAMEGERKLVTVLFADVANFTSLSEKLDPEEVHGIMDGCFKILMDEIHKYEGTINQFTGDGVMALFGAPIAHEDHAQRACYAALAIQRAMVGYGERVGKDHGVDFMMRIGLNSGPVVVGSIGDDLRMDYTAQGDTANLASRMESSAEPGAIMASQHIYRQAKEFFEFESLGEIQVKGKKEPVDTYRLVRPTEVETRIAASAAKGLTRFVGRTREIEALKESFEKVKSGEGQVVGIVGEAGVGKSRLLLEFRNLLLKGEVTHFEGRCLHYGGSMPYLPILDVLRSYIGVKEGEQELVIRQKLNERIHELDENLQHVIPPFQELLSVKADDEGFAKLEPKQKREKTFEAIRDLLIRGSHDRPLVLVVEDLHWIDKTSEEFLNYMIGWLPKTRILLLLLYRPEYTHQWGSKSYYSLIGVGQLSMSTSAELVAAILDGGDIVPELRDLILKRAAGNPLFMEELTHALLQNGSIQKKDDRFVLTRDVSSVQVPDTIQGIIAARMDRLEESLKRIMQVASVIGREFAFRILETIIEMKEELKAGLINLQGLEFIYEKSLFPELEYIFRHALVQEVAYNSLLINRRKEIHEKIGLAIENLYPNRLEEFYEILAYHYARGEVLEKASRYLKLSGSKATRNHSLWAAYSSYKEALATLRRLPDTEENKKEYLEVLRLAVLPLNLLGFPEGSLEILQEGEGLSKDLHDNRHLAFFFGRLSAYYAIRGDAPLGVKYSEKALELARRSRDIDLIVRITPGLCASYMGTGRHSKVVDIVPGFLDLLEKTEQESNFFAMSLNPYSWLCGYCGISMGYLGNFEEGKIVLEKGLRHAVRIGDLTMSGLVESCCGMFFLIKGDWKPVKEHLQNSIKINEEVKFLLGLAWSWGSLGLAISYLGDPETGGKYVEKGLKIQRDAGFEMLLSMYPLFLGIICYQQGDLMNARHFADEALRLSQKNNEKHFEGHSWIWLGRIVGRMEKPQIGKAEEYILQGMKMLDELKLKPFYAQGCLFLGEVLADAGDREKALESLKKAESMFQEMGMDYWLGKAQEELKRLGE